MLNTTTFRITNRPDPWEYQTLSANQLAVEMGLDKNTVKKALYDLGLDPVKWRQWVTPEGDSIEYPVYFRATKDFIKKHLKEVKTREEQEINYEG